MTLLASEARPVLAGIPGVVARHRRGEVRMGEHRALRQRRWCRRYIAGARRRRRHLGRKRGRRRHLPMKSAIVVTPRGAPASARAGSAPDPIPRRRRRRAGRRARSPCSFCAFGRSAAQLVVTSTRAPESLSLWASSRSASSALMWTAPDARLHAGEEGDRVIGRVRQVEPDRGARPDAAGEEGRGEAVDLVGEIAIADGAVAEVEDGPAGRAGKAAGRAAPRRSRPRSAHPRRRPAGRISPRGTGGSWRGTDAPSSRKPRSGYPGPRDHSRRPGPGSAPHRCALRRVRDDAGLDSDDHAALSSLAFCGEAAALAGEPRQQRRRLERLVAGAGRIVRRGGRR